MASSDSESLPLPESDSVSSGEPLSTGTSSSASDAPAPPKVPQQPSQTPPVELDKPAVEDVPLQATNSQDSDPELPPSESSSDTCGSTTKPSAPPAAAKPPDGSSESSKDSDNRAPSAKQPPAERPSKASLSSDSDKDQAPATVAAEPPPLAEPPSKTSLSSDSDKDKTPATVAAEPPPPAEPPSKVSLSSDSDKDKTPATVAAEPPPPAEPPSKVSLSSDSDKDKTPAKASAKGSFKVKLSSSSGSGEDGKPPKPATEPPPGENPPDHTKRSSSSSGDDDGSPLPVTIATPTDNRKHTSRHKHTSEQKETPEPTDMAEQKDKLKHKSKHNDKLKLTDATGPTDPSQPNDATEPKDASGPTDMSERKDKSGPKQVPAPLERIQPPERSQRGIRTAQARAFAVGSEADRQRRCPTRELTVKELTKERERESKWIQILPSEGATGHSVDFRQWRTSHSTLFRDLILEGIPDSVRSHAWRVVLDSGTEKPNVPTAQEYAEQAVPECDAAIRGDIARIIVLMAPFATTDIAQSLYTVLRGYANFDAELGYRDGMGYVAALLVSYMTENQAFRAFQKVMRGKELHLRDYHLGGTLQQALTLWTYLLKNHFKKFHDYCKKIRISHIYYLRVWFLHFFLSVDFLPVLRLRIWDRITAFGARAILSLGLAFMSLLEKDLLKRGKEEVILTLQNPILGVQEGDWRNVIKKWNKFWIGTSEYKEILAKASVQGRI